MDVLAVRGAADDRARMGARRQGADPARAEDLPLSRPFDVRPGQIPLARGSAGGAREVRPDRGGQARARRGWASSEDELKKIDNEIKQIVVEAADFAEQSPEPEPAELYTDVLVESY